MIWHWHIQFPQGILLIINHMHYLHQCISYMYDLTHLEGALCFISRLDLMKKMTLNSYVFILK